MVTDPARSSFFNCIRWLASNVFDLRHFTCWFSVSQLLCAIATLSTTENITKRYIWKVTHSVVRHLSSANLATVYQQKRWQLYARVCYSDNTVCTKYRQRSTFKLNTIYAHLFSVSLQAAYKKYIQMAEVQRFHEDIRRLRKVLDVYHVLFKPQ